MEEGIHAADEDERVSCNFYFSIHAIHLSLTPDGNKAQR
jgi:hypothetical protein